MPNYPSDLGLDGDVPELTPWTSGKPKPAPTPAVTAATAPAATAASAGAAGAAAAPQKPAKGATARLLASMTLEEKVGQLLFPGGRAEFLADDDPRFLDLVRLVEETKAGGICWFRSEPLELAAVNARLQAKARVPLLMAADLESGPGMRLEALTWGPWPMAIAASGDPDLARRRARATAAQARALGVRQVYAPVADVNSDPDNPVINVRSFGEDPAEVSRFVAATVQGLQEGGVLATLKHFPGHGDTSVDSHISLPVLPADRARLERVELPPFRAGIAAGARSVMTAHLAVPAIDATPVTPLARPAANEIFDPVLAPAAPRPAGAASTSAASPALATLPATLSPKITDGLLRGEMKFAGLVVTDSMSMGAVATYFDAGEAAVRAVEAGADVVLHSPDNRAAATALLAAVRSGRLPEARMDASVRRILEEKERLGLFESPAPPLASIFALAGTREQRDVEAEAARRGLTLVREEAGILPLRREAKVAHVSVLDEDTFPGLDATATAELKKRLATPPVVARVPPASCDADVDRAASAAAQADVVVLSIFVRARSGKGKIALPEAGRRAIEKVLASGRPVVAISFGSPYVVREFPSMKSYLAAWGVQEVSQVAAVRALFGEAAVGGKLPVAIPGVAERGTGIARPGPADGGAK